MTVVLVGGMCLVSVLSCVYLAIITRTLRPAGFAHFALILSTAQLISIIVSFESWQVIVKFGQEHVQNSDTERFGRLFGFCIAIDLCAAIVGCLIAALATFLLGPYFGWSHELSLQALAYCAVIDRKSTRLNSRPQCESRMQSSAC